MSNTYKLEQVDVGRNNNFNLIRLIAAILVIYSHSYWVTGNELIEPLSRLCGILNFGTLGLKIFFFISGYLITKSIYHQPTLNSFIKARFLRIFPGLFLTTLFCAFLIGPICTDLPLGQYFRDGKVYDFVVRMATLQGDFYSLPGVFQSNPGSTHVNIPIWTLPAELFMYFFVLLWGAALLVWQRKFKALLFSGYMIPVFALCWCIPYLPKLTQYIAEFGFLFFGGMLCYLFKNKVILNIPLLLGMLVLFLALFHYRSSWAPTLLNIVLLYGILLVAYHPKLQLKSLYNLGDFSYGLYIYAFPVQQLMVLRFRMLTPAENFFFSIVPTLGIAILSW